MRTIVYIDGFNLYFAMKEKGWRKYYWLNVYAFAQSLLLPNQQLIMVKYFTSRISGDGKDTGKSHRQGIYLDAIQTLPNVEVYFGQYRMKDGFCHKCGVTLAVPEEKMTDVNIATEMLLDAFYEKFDQALLISADSDLCAPVRSIKETIGKRITVIFPPGRWSTSLAESASASTSFGHNKLRNSQFTKKVLGRDGFVLERPIEWQ
jgi:uncharacterized LabA/DUF88 family protein